MKPFEHIASRALACGIALLAALAPAHAAPAEAWPERPIRIIVGNAAGSAPDMFARLYAEQLAKTLNQAVIVENRPGATANIAQNAVAKAPADGYTLLYSIANSFTTHPFLYEELPFDARKDFAPVAPLVAQGLFLVASNDFPASSVSDMVKIAKEKKGEVAYASYGNGGYPHLIMEMIADSEGLQMMHVPYKSGAIRDVVAGRVPLVVEPAATAVPLFQAGRIKALGYTPTQRHPLLPDVAPISETIPGVELTAWHGVWAPAGTPEAIIQKLNQAFAQASRAPDVQARIRARYCEPMTSSPAEMAALIEQDAKRWGQIIQSRHIKLD